LTNGATLILNSCEEVSPPLRALCVHLQRLFHVGVIVNLYAGWRHDNGFDVHWDDQDTLILQVSGRKHWKVWEPTRLHPFKEDLVDTSPKTKPETPPIWDAVLDCSVCRGDGGTLRIPWTSRACTWP
jgi:ribosomal protein L16 Arg81 hydroxylase